MEQEHVDNSARPDLEIHQVAPPKSFLVLVKTAFDRICAFVKTRIRTLYLGKPDKQ